jgi:glycosyltransferase involved in cell wall biosynthesis
MRRWQGNEMTIAINAAIVDSFISGLGVYTVSLCRELAKLYDDLLVYTAHPGICDVTAAQLRQIRWRRQTTYGRMGHARRLLWTQAILPLRLMADRAKLLFSPLPEGMLVSMIPQVIAVHDVLPLRFPAEYPRQQYYFRHLVPAMLRKAAAVVAVSENTKRDLLTFYRLDAGRIQVVAGGYDRNRYRVGLVTEGMRTKYGLQDYVLYVGNLLPHKNLRQLLNAFALISKQFPHALVIAGRKDPRYYPALEAETAALGIRKQVSFLDYVPAEDLPALYAGADVFVLPSLYEGFGLPILEAMACGTPVIASRTSSIPEIAGNAAVLVNPDDVSEMAYGLETVLGDRGMREGMQQKGLAQAAQFGWSETAVAILNILEAAKL